jgi:hypothetical protein
MKPRKTRVLVLASPNGTLSMCIAGRMHEGDYRKNWQVLFHYKVVNPFYYKNATYDYAVHAYGL